MIILTIMTILIMVVIIMIIITASSTLGFSFCCVPLSTPGVTRGQTDNNKSFQARRATVILFPLCRFWH